MTDVNEPYPVTEAYRAPADPGRVLASAVAVLLGGYLLLLAVNSQLPTVFAGYGNVPLAYGVLLVLQLVFAVLVVVFGFAVAPASPARKLIASAIVVVAVIVLLLTIVARLTTGFGGVGNAVTHFTVANPWLIITLSVGAGWLVVRAATVGWLALLPALVLSPLPFLFTINSLEFGVQQLVLLALTAVIGAVIIVAGRPWRG